MVVSKKGSNRYDNFLILLTFLAPLLLIALSKWQASLNTWYMPLNQNPSEYFQHDFHKDIKKLSAYKTYSGAQLWFIADPNCPCTRASLTILKKAIQEAQRQDLKLIQMNIGSPQELQPEFKNLLRHIPAAPTLIVLEGERLVYAGPVNAGNMCTTQVLKILGLSILETQPQKPVINWLEQGCYCRVKV